MRILVTGASGFVGSHLVPALCDASHDVAALVRDQTQYDAPGGVTVTEGDLLEPGSFERAVTGIDAAYYLVHSMGSGTGFEARDRRAAHNFAHAASTAGIDRVVYLGGLGNGNDRLSRHLRSRREVEQILDDGKYELTVLRAAIIIGEGSMSFEIIRQLTERLPLVVASTEIETPCQPIAIDDVIDYLLGVLSAPETVDETFEIGGPDVLTYKEILSRIACATRGRKPRVVTVPISAARLSAHWMAMLTDVSVSVAKPLLHSATNPVIASDDRIQTHVPIELTPFDDAVEQSLTARTTPNQ